MGALPPFRQIQFNQIPGAPAWFAAFLTSLNQFLSSTYDLANKGTTLTDNVPAQVKTLTVQVGNDGTFPQQSFALTLKSKPQAVLLAQVSLRHGTAGNTAISLNQWSYGSGTVIIDSLVGLAAGNTYDLTFLVF